MPDPIIELRDRYLAGPGRRHTIGTPYGHRKEEMFRELVQECMEHGVTLAVRNAEVFDAECKRLKLEFTFERARERAAKTKLKQRGDAARKTAENQRARNAARPKGGALGAARWDVIRKQAAERDRALYDEYLAALARHEPTSYRQLALARGLPISTVSSACLREEMRRQQAQVSVPPDAG